MVAVSVLHGLRPQQTFRRFSAFQNGAGSEGIFTFVRVVVLRLSSPPTSEYRNGHGSFLFKVSLVKNFCVKLFTDVDVV